MFIYQLIAKSAHMLISKAINCESLRFIGYAFQLNLRSNTKLADPAIFILAAFYLTHTQFCVQNIFFIKYLNYVYFIALFVYYTKAIRNINRKYVRIIFT